MRQVAIFFLLAVMGCGRSGKTAKDQDLDLTREEQPPQTKEKKESAVTRSSPWVWGYFLTAPEKSAVDKLPGEFRATFTRYRVDRVVGVTGEPAVQLSPGTTLFRLETAARIGLPEGTAAKLLFQGVPQHLEYTTKSQRTELLQSRAEVPASADTVAVIIPIRKSAAWWSLAVDERMAHFQKSREKPGHTAIGAEYIDRIYRKLYHTRYSIETTDHDFITYFEFLKANEEDFKSLLKKLRDKDNNPEWGFVDREYEIWMTKLE